MCCAAGAQPQRAQRRCIPSRRQREQGPACLYCACVPRPCTAVPQVTGSFDKVELLKSYKFCVAMENSITKDYITEKLWQVGQG